MRMLLAGVSPFIINSICNICVENFPQNSEMFKATEIYENTVLCIIGKPADSSFSRVFRKGVESPVAAFDRILRSILDYVYIDADTLWKTDEAVETAVDDFTLVQKTMEKSLHGALVEASKDDSISSSLRISILDLLSNNFETTVDDRELAKSIKVGGLLKTLWDIEVFVKI
jgi:hypothetical protein